MNNIIYKRFFILPVLILILSFPGYGQKKFQAKLSENERGEGKWGIVNKRGKEVIPCDYDTIFFLTENFIAGAGLIQNDTLKAGVIARKNEALIPFIYKNVELVNNLILAYSHMNFWGVYSPEGQVIEEPAYKSYSIKDSTIELVSFKKWKVFNVEGRVTDEVDADSLGTVDSKLVAYRNKEAFFVSQFNSRTDYSAESIKANYCIFENTFTDSTSIKPDSILATYDSVYSYSEGFIGVGKEGFCGFIDTSGKIRISLQYEAVKAFSEGLAPVKIMKKWAYINQHEDIIIQPTFEEVTPFCGGTALVKKDGKQNFIDKKGAIRNSEGFDWVYRVNNGNWEVGRGKYKGLVNSLGQEKIIPKYEDLVDFGNGFVKVKKHGLFGVLDYDQNIIVPIRFTEVHFNPTGLFFAGNVGRNKILKLERTSY